MRLAGITIERDLISRIENGTRFVPDCEIRVLSAIFDISALWLLGMELFPKYNGSDLFLQKPHAHFVREAFARNTVSTHKDGICYETILK